MASSLNLLNKYYIVPLRPEGGVIHFVLYSNHQHRELIGLNKIVVRFSASASTHPNFGGTESKQLDRFLDQIDGENFNVLKLNLEPAAKISSIRFYNNTEDLSAGVKDIGVYIDRKLVFQVE